MKNTKSQWTSNIKGDLIAGIVVAMALIPAAIGFSIVAGVDPMIGVYGSFIITVITSIFGGRPGLISGSAGAMALVLASLVKSHGVEYMLAATVLTGILQVVMGFFKVGNLMKFIPKPVMIGFVNALGILMFTSQLEHFKDGPILVALAVLGVAIIYLLPKLNEKVPAPIVAIAIITIISVVFNLDLKVLGDMGNITNSLPRFLVPDIPFNFETLEIIFPYAFSLAIVGIVETLLTAQLIDEVTDTPSDKNRESVGQGLGNIVVGFFGGIAGCGMIGQSVLNLKYGGRGRLSTLTAGTSMFLIIILLNKVVVAIPVVAFASVMIVVASATFNWTSIKRLRKVPKSDTFVMLSTVIVVLVTGNLAYGVVLGVILSGMLFASKMSEIEVEKQVNGQTTNYQVKGELFFVSSQRFIDSFDYLDNNKEVIIDFSNTKIRDESAVDAIDKVVVRLHKNGIKTNLIGLSDSCINMIDKMGVSDQLIKDI